MERTRTTTSTRTGSNRPFKRARSTAEADGVESGSTSTSAADKNHNKNKKQKQDSELETSKAPENLDPSLQQDGKKPKNAAQIRKRNPICFFDLRTKNSSLGRILFELYADTTPETANAVRALCTGEVGRTYKNGIVSKIVPSQFAQISLASPRSTASATSDINNEKAKTPKEKKTLLIPTQENSHRHLHMGTLSIANHITGDVFFALSETPMRWFDVKHTVIGKCIQGMDILRRLNKFGRNSDGDVKEKIEIIASGRVKQKPKHSKNETETDSLDGDNESEFTQTTSDSTQSLIDSSPIHKDSCERCSGPLRYVQRTKKGLRMRCKNVACGHSQYVVDVKSQLDN